MKKKYLLLLEEKINYYVKALCVLIFRIRFVFPEAFIIAYASLPKLQTLRFADYNNQDTSSIHTMNNRFSCRRSGLKHRHATNLRQHLS